MKPDQCQATTRTGGRCSAQAVDGVHCPWHSTADEWVAKRSEWSAKGGANRSNRARAQKTLDYAAMSPATLHGVLSKSLTDVLHGTLEPGRANAAAALAKTLIAIAETVDLETRLTKLETALNERRTA